MKVFVLAVPVFEVKTQRWDWGSSQMYPRRALSPLNSSPKIFPSIVRRLPSNSPQNTRETNAQSLVLPATSKNTFSQQDTPQVEKSLPPKLITPKIVPSRFFRPNLPQSTSLRNSPKIFQYNFAPNALRISQSSWRLPNIPVNIFPRFDFTALTWLVSSLSKEVCPNQGMLLQIHVSEMPQIQKKTRSWSFEVPEQVFRKAGKSWNKAEFLTYDVIFHDQRGRFSREENFKSSTLISRMVFLPFLIFCVYACFCGLSPHMILLQTEREKNWTESKIEGGRICYEKRKDCTKLSLPFSLFLFSLSDYPISRLYVHSMLYFFPLKITVSIYLPIFTDLSLGHTKHSLKLSCVSHAHVTSPEPHKCLVCLWGFGGGTINNDSIYGFGPKTTVWACG